jgi:hypothetical protein
MATESKPTLKTVALPVAKPKQQFIETVYGRMVDLTTGIEYTSVPKEIIRVNGWLQSQLDAGKMKLTEK